ncbi:MAG TPA: FAD-dependent oxidoreductase [Anaerolineae bacterium]|nr:FAD-dependent oxidoreductase [Anaerolineae bacterium]HQK14108.1 FAD-dependent oxidoreductase [Anaerolineae bacterium]
MTEEHAKPVVAVIGAGPAGLFGAGSLVEHGARVVLLNRDIKPGGLAEYGIYYDKYSIKEGLRKQFRKILASPDITYYGNVSVEEDGDVTLAELRQMGFAAIMVAVGAQGTKWLGLPGEDLKGVYHSKPLLYHYNNLPPFSEQEFTIGKRVALIGVGNVMADIAHWLTRDVRVDEIIAVARRGPAEVKFTRQEMEYIARNFDLEDLDAEIVRVADRVRAVGQDPDEAKNFILSALSRRALEPVSATRIRFRFLSSPRRILANAEGGVAGLEVDDTELVLQENGETRARRLDTQRVLDVDTVIFCIGDKVSECFGLPVQGSEFVKNPTPRYPVDGESYEVFDPQTNTPIEGVFVAGWARKASKGQVGLARKDAGNCVEAIMRYIGESPGFDPAAAEKLAARLTQLHKPLVRKEDWQRLEAIEQQKAAELGVELFKFKSNAEMLAAMGLRSYL